MHVIVARRRGAGRGRRSSCLGRRPRAVGGQRGRRRRHRPLRACPSAARSWSPARRSSPRTANSACGASPASKASSSAVTHTWNWEKTGARPVPKDQTPEAQKALMAAFQADRAKFDAEAKAEGYTSAEARGVGRGARRRPPCESRPRRRRRKPRRPPPPRRPPRPRRRATNLTLVR